MSTVNLTNDTFQETIDDNDIVLIDFWADWCGPCKAFAPVYEKVSETHSDIVFGKVDTESEPQLAGAFRISAIPTLVAFRGGIGVFSQPGMMPEAGLEELIKQLRALDMDEVRKQVEAERAAAPSS
jgi:thioredoxin 1